MNAATLTAAPMNDAPSLTQVNEFIVRFDPVYSGKLSGFYNYSRVVALCWLERLLAARGLKAHDSVGVISGSAQEPELKLISYRSLDVLSFDLDRRYDLDVDWSTQAPRDFSFTLCNQVLEHVFDPHLAFRNVLHHTRRGGLVFISIPTINCIHGEPHFYSSGFHPRWLERLAAVSGVDVLGISYWGTSKYLLHAVTGTWLTDQNLRPGFHGPHDFRFPNMVFADGRSSDDPYTRAMQMQPVITDCWGLFAKR
jgi:hypothetical protein